jgi:hypothetical protein
MVTETNDGVPAASLYGFRPLLSKVSALPGLNVWVPVGSVTDSYALYVMFYHNTAGGARDVEAELTIDGTVFTVALSLPDSTVYYLYIDRYTDTLAATNAITPLAYTQGLYCKTMLYRMRTVDVIDDVTNLTGKVRFFST